MPKIQYHGELNYDTDQSFSLAANASFNKLNKDGLKAMIEALHNSHQKNIHIKATKPGENPVNEEQGIDLSLREKNRKNNKVNDIKVSLFYNKREDKLVKQLSLSLLNEYKNTEINEYGKNMIFGESKFVWTPIHNTENDEGLKKIKNHLDLAFSFKPFSEINFIKAVKSNIQYYQLKI